MQSNEILEREVLGAIFLEPSIVKDVLAAAPLDLFKQPSHRVLYRMVQDLANKGMDINLTNIATVYTKHLDKIGGISGLTHLISSVVTAADIDNKIKQLMELDARQKAMELVKEFYQKFDDPSTGAFDEILDQFEQRSLQIRPKTNRENKNIDALIDWYEDLVLRTQDPNRAFGIMTGWDALDRMTLGFQRTNLIVIGARTSMGKSALAGEIENRANRRGHKVASFSLEMSAAQKYTRAISNLCHIPMQAIRTGNLTPGQVDKINDHLEDLRRIHIDDSRGITAEYITSEMRRLKRQNGLDLVVIDYLQEVVEPHERNDNSGSGLHRVCQKLRTAAKDCDCAVIGLSQVKQDVDARANKRPFVSDLYGSAAISAVADDIILLYRDEYYNPDTEDKGILELNLAKQRNGPTGTIKLRYDKDYQKITGKETPKYEQAVGV